MEANFIDNYATNNFRKKSFVVNILFDIIEKKNDFEGYITPPTNLAEGVGTLSMLIREHPLMIVTSSFFFDPIFGPSRLHYNSM